MKNLIIDLKVHEDSRGKLIAIESMHDVPFSIKRTYYVFDTPENEVRGFHAHKALNQFLWSPTGGIEILMDDGNEKKVYVLDNAKSGLLVPCGYWHEMKWLSKEAILCVVASDYYVEEDYIRNYEEFKDHVVRGYWHGNQI